MKGEQTLFDHLDPPPAAAAKTAVADKAEGAGKAAARRPESVRKTGDGVQADGVRKAGDGGNADGAAKAPVKPRPAKASGEAKAPPRARAAIVKASDAYRTISEVAGELDVPQHVLRFWESKFSQIRPLKRGGGRRYYRPDDVKLIRAIRSLLHHQGYTIKGVQRLLRSMPLADVVAVAESAAAAPVLRAPGAAERDPAVESGETAPPAAATEAQPLLRQALEEARAMQRLLGQLLAPK
jgi:DNA-binding transcriptional MerR regulator